MSDTAQGPDWWQASDNKWYPPEAHPDYRGQAPAPPSPQPPQATHAGMPSPPQPTPAPAPPGGYSGGQPGGYSQPPPPAGMPMWTNPAPPGGGQPYGAQQYGYAPATSPSRPGWFWPAMAITAAIAVISIGTIIILAASGGDSNAEPTTTIEEVSDNNKNDKKGNKGASTDTTEPEPEPEPTPTEPTEPPPTEPKPTDPPTTPAPTKPKPTDPPTTPAPTTEAPQPTEPEPQPSGDAEKYQTVVFPEIFAASRDALLDGLMATDLIETVDRYEYDPEQGTVFFVFTPVYDTETGVRDDAWLFTIIFASFWTDEVWVDPNSGWSPNFDIEVSTAHYGCTGPQMQKIEAGEWRRADWDDECRIN